MTSRSFKLATVHGVDVTVAPSWLLVTVAIVVSYQRSFVGDGRSVALTVTMAVAAGLLFTGSVLLHELAHALEGQHRGAEIGGISLFLLGGATALRGGDRRAADEFAIAAIGPWSNIVLAALFGLAAAYAGTYDLDAFADVAGLLGWLNLGLAVFNLIPGAPLDGGRVLRAAVWAVTGDRNRATTIAAVVGIVLAIAMVGWAFVLIGTRAGGVVPGIWLGLIGAYVLRAARGELVRGRLSSWLARRPAAELAPATPRVTSAVTDDELRELFDGPDAPRVVLVDDGGEPVGVLAHDSWPQGPLGIADVPVVAADAPGDELSGLLDRDQPLVLLRDGDRTWLSTIHLIDRRIRDLRDGSAPPVAEVAP